MAPIPTIYNKPSRPKKRYRLSRASAGPPQIIRVHFQPRDLATSCWLRQEIRKVLLFVPFISTTGGCGSKVFAAESRSDPLFALAAAAEAVSTSTPRWLTFASGTPAAAHAAGLEMPAFCSAAAIFCCCVIAEVLIATDSGGLR